MTITFNAICSLLQSIENISTRSPRLPKEREKTCCNDIISQWCANHRAELDDPLTNGGAVLSALLPHRRKDRVYGMQAPLLARKLIALLKFNAEQIAIFREWRRGAHGDLGAYTERAMTTWDGTFSSKQEFCLGRIDHLLIQLAAKVRFSDEDIRNQRNVEYDADRELKTLLVRLESWEAKWLVRLILREFSTTELDEYHLFRSYHFLLPDLLMFQNDFDAAFRMLRSSLKTYKADPEPSQEVSLRIKAAKKLRAEVGVKVGRPTFYKAWSFKHLFDLVGTRAWAAEAKYDGEYCEIHVDLTNEKRQIKIYSKNGKDATIDRKGLHTVIFESLRIGRPGCLLKKNCILLGEMVLYSDKDRTILPFSKIRKHVSRSGSFCGTDQDSLPHSWEHLMIVFFDLLALDNKAILRHCFQERRKILRDLVQVIPGRSMRSEWTLIDFKTGDGITDLKQVFSRSLANRQEGLILKPLHAPYFPLVSDRGSGKAGFFIKMKKDYLGDMGGERDLGDFAIIGASFDPQVAAKLDLKPLHWTHFYLACCTNFDVVQRTGVRPKFKVVALLSADASIPKTELKYLNIHGHVGQLTLLADGSTAGYDIDPSRSFDRRMTAAFKRPFVAEILGGGYEKYANETFEMLRHPRMKKIHHDRTWDDAVTMQDLERMAAEKWDFPAADKLDGHARDVAKLVKRYVKEANGSQCTVTTSEATQETTQRSTTRSTSGITSTQDRSQSPSLVSEIPETQQDSNTTEYTNASSSPINTQNRSIRASRDWIIREDTSERIAALVRPRSRPQLPLSQSSTASAPQVGSSPTSSAPVSSAGQKRGASFVDLISPPAPRRRKVVGALMDSSGN